MYVCGSYNITIILYNVYIYMYNYDSMCEYLRWFTDNNLVKYNTVHKVHDFIVSLKLKTTSMPSYFQSV